MCHHSIQSIGSWCQVSMQNLPAHPKAGCYGKILAILNIPDSEVEYKLLFGDERVYWVAQGNTLPGQPKGPFIPGEPI